MPLLISYLSLKVSVSVSVSIKQSAFVQLAHPPGCGACFWMLLLHCWGNLLVTSTVVVVIAPLVVVSPYNYSFYSDHVSLMWPTCGRNSSKVLEPTSQSSPVADQIKPDELNLYKLVEGKVEQGGSFVPRVNQLVMNQCLPRAVLVHGA